MILSQDGIFQSQSFKKSVQFATYRQSPLKKSSEGDYSTLENEKRPIQVWLFVEGGRVGGGGKWWRFPDLGGWCRCNWNLSPVFDKSFEDQEKSGAKPTEIELSPLPFLKQFGFFSSIVIGVAVVAAVVVLSYGLEHIQLL